jgi:hypothetical protein
MPSGGRRRFPIPDEAVRATWNKNRSSLIFCKGYGGLLDRVPCLWH